MKRFQTAAAIGALLLAPSLVFAQTGTSASVNTTVTASSTRPMPPRPMDSMPKPGPAIRSIIENTRAGIKGVASTTKENLRATASTTGDMLKARVNAVQQFVGDRKEELRAHLIDKRQELAERAEGAKEAARAKYSQGVQTSVGNMVDRLNKATEELGAIADRIDARIQEHQAAGKTMTNSAALLAAARIDIAAAQDASVALSVALETALASETPKTQMEKVRAAAKAAQDALQTAKKSLKETLEQVRLESSSSASAEATI